MSLLRGQFLCLLDALFLNIAVRGLTQLLCCGLLNNDTVRHIRSESILV